MIGRAVRSQAMKLRRTWVLPLVGLGPFGVVSITALRYAIEYHGLVHAGADNWLRLAQGINSLLVPSLVLGIAILGALLAGMEHRASMWKVERALPVRAWDLYLAEFLTLCGLLAAAALLCVLGTAILGTALGLGAVPWPLVWLEGVRPYLAAYAVIGLQLALSVLIANQAFAMAGGIGAVILSAASRSTTVPAWLPWSYPGLASPAGTAADPWRFVFAGLGVGALALAIGGEWFRRQESP